MEKVKRSAKVFWALRIDPELLVRIRIKAKAKGKMASWVRAKLWEAVNK
jgi:predicted HicB family RNase H-like nuclease